MKIRITPAVLSNYVSDNTKQQHASYVYFGNQTSPGLIEFAIAVSDPLVEVSNRVGDEEGDERIQARIRFHRSKDSFTQRRSMYT